MEDVIKPPGSLLLTVLSGYFMLYCILLLVCFVVFCGSSTTLVGKGRASFLLLFICNFMVSVSGRFLFLLVLGMGRAIRL